MLFVLHPVSVSQSLVLKTQGFSDFSRFIFVNCQPATAKAHFPTQTSLCWICGGTGTRVSPGT
jgi:hypothetical protein